MPKRPENQTVRQLATLHEVQRTSKRLYRRFLLLHELRGVDQDPPRAGTRAPPRLAGVGLPVQLKPLIKLAPAVRSHKDGVFAGIELGLSHSRLEGLTSTSPIAPTASTPRTRSVATVYLCASITIDLPGR